ncbi:MAG: MATE family efflux transporter [Clostridiales bacterium]|nr:MATE family efflux transporter [Clostridiales bacterium]
MQKKKEKQYTMDMCEGPLFGKILLFTLPLMLSSVLQLLFNAADVIVVGNFAGSQSLAAVGSTGSLINLLTNLFIGLSVGVNVSVAHFMGAGEKERIAKTVHTSILLSMLSGIFLAFFGIGMARLLLIWMASPADVIDLATVYLRIYFMGMPALMLYNFGSAILRAAGDTRRPLYYLFFAGIVNVLLNLLFVIGLNMGVAGVATATVLSEYISGFLVLWCLMKEEGSLHLELRNLRIHWDIVKQLLRIGLPAGIQGTIFSLSNVVIQSSINSFGSTVMAGSAAAANLEGFVYVSMNALYQTALTFVSQNYGAGKRERIPGILLRCQGMVVFVGLVLGNGAFLLGRQLLSIYSQDSHVIEAGMHRMAVICCFYFLCGMMDVMVGTLRGIGYSVMPMIVSLLGACGLRLLWIATIFTNIHTERVLYLSYPVSWFLTASVHFLTFLAVWRRIKKKNL